MHHTEFQPALVQRGIEAGIAERHSRRGPPPQLLPGDGVEPARRIEARGDWRVAVLQVHHLFSKFQIRWQRWTGRREPSPAGHLRKDYRDRKSTRLNSSH